MTNTQQEIHKKGFDLVKPTSTPTDSYAKLKIGAKQYADALLDLQYYEKLERRGFRNKEFIIQALIDNDIPTLRLISKYFYKTNGIYQKIVNYFATMYRYDWYMVPELLSDNYIEITISSMDKIKVIKILQWVL